jgi:phosphinothricin acetyltransferase
VGAVEGHAVSHRYRVRLATPDDAPAICRIYNQGIEDRVATLETELRTPEERRRWLTSRSARHPVIVAEPAPTISTPEISTPERAGEAREPASPIDAREPARSIAGWGSLNVYNPREAYRFVADFSIYVDRAWRGKGVGDVMLARLVELAREHGFHKMVLSAFPTNTGGMALYTKHGFRTVGIFKEQGVLDGRWVDTIVMEKLL